MMKIHYDGQFSFIAGEDLGYFGGEVMWCNCLDPEEMSLVVIDSYLVDVGYVEKLQVTSLDANRRKNGYFYYWKLEEKQLKGGLKKLTLDKDVLDTGVEVVRVGHVVDVYLSTDAISDEETINIGGFHVEGFTIDTEVTKNAYSDYGLSDQLNLTFSSDKESGEQGRQKRWDFNKNKEIGDTTFMVGQVFEDFATFKTADHSIVTKRPISFLKSDPTCVQVGCKNRTCRWYIYVSKSNDNGGVEIKSCYLVHDGCIMDFENKFADYKYIARKYVIRFLIDPYWGIDSIIQTVHEDLHLQIGREKVGRVRKHGVELVRGK
ncbi:hypothetical protein LINPERHAP1_LOCUS17647 [Linum perenne]